MKQFYLTIASLLFAGSIVAKTSSDSEPIPVKLVHIGWENQVKDTGYWTLSAYSADSAYWVYLTNFSPVKQVAGTYTTYDIDDFSSFLYDLERTGTQMQYYKDLTVQIDSINDKFVLSARYTTEAGLVYDITADSIPAITEYKLTNLGVIPFNSANKTKDQTNSLSGQPLAPGTKGLQIKNGKKLLAK